MTDKLGETGKPRRGKLADNDEGSLRFWIVSDQENGIVIVKYGMPVAWIGLRPDEAREYAAQLIIHADKLEPPV